MEDFEEDYENDPRWHTQGLDDFRARYPRASLSNGPRYEQYPSQNEEMRTHREISTKELTKPSKSSRLPDPWEGPLTYPAYSVNQGFESDLPTPPPPPKEYRKQEQRVSMIFR